MVGLRDYYAWMTDPRIKRIGSTAWVMLAMMILEALVVFKFRAHLWKGVQPPTEVTVAWAVGLALLIGFVLVRFTPAGASLRGTASSPAGAPTAVSDLAPRDGGAVPVKAVPATPALATAASDDAAATSAATSEDEVEAVASPHRRSRSPAASARRRRSVPRSGAVGAAAAASTSSESSSKTPRRI